MWLPCVLESKMRVWGCTFFCGCWLSALSVRNLRAFFCSLLPPSAISQCWTPTQTIIHNTKLWKLWWNFMWLIDLAHFNYVGSGRTSSADTAISFVFSSASWRMKCTICWICLLTSSLFIFDCFNAPQQNLQFLISSCITNLTKKGHFQVTAFGYGVLLDKQKCTDPLYIQESMCWESIFVLPLILSTWKGFKAVQKYENLHKHLPRRATVTPS